VIARKDDIKGKTVKSNGGEETMSMLKGELQEKWQLERQV